MQFAACEEPALIGTEFTHEVFAPHARVMVRGKDEWPHEGKKPFQWSHAVRALTGYLVRCAAWSRREIQQVPNSDSPCHHNGGASKHLPCLEGVRPSAASSVLDAINAKVNWICDMFGSDREGRPYLAHLLRWSNPSQRPGEPVSLRLNQKRLCPCRLQVKVGNDQVNEPQALDILADKIERTWRPNGRTPTPESPSGRTGFEIRIQGNLPEFLATGGEEKLLKLLKEHGVRDVQIIRRESGSIKLTLSLPEDQAERLFWLADSGALDRLGLLDFKYVPLAQEVPVTIAPRAAAPVGTTPP
jgi:hypothetical protein